jgi:hypothetical protein
VLNINLQVEGEYAAGATAGTIATSGANLKIQAGYYKMEVDTEKLTYKVTAVRGEWVMVLRWLGCWIR